MKTIDRYDHSYQFDEYHETTAAANLLQSDTRVNLLKPYVVYKISWHMPTQTITVWTRYNHKIDVTHKKYCNGMLRDRYTSEYHSFTSSVSPAYVTRLMKQITKHTAWESIIHATENYLIVYLTCQD